MVSAVDRYRIFIFVGITCGIVIAAALVIFFDPGHKSDCTPVTLLAIIFSNLIGYVPSLVLFTTRLISREGWSNAYLRPNRRRGWPYRSHQPRRACLSQLGTNHRCCLGKSGFYRQEL